MSLVIIGQLATGTSLEFTMWMSVLWVQFGVVCYACDWLCRHHTFLYSSACAESNK